MLSQLQDKEFARVEDTSKKLHEEVESEALLMGYNAVYLGTQVHKNSSLIMPFFNDSFGQYIAENFPRRSNDVIIEVDDFDVGIYLKDKTCHEIMPDNSKHQVNLTRGDDKHRTDTLSTHRAGQYEETSSIVYYKLTGVINYTIRDSKSSICLKKSMSFGNEIRSCFPLLESKFKVLEANSDGSSSNIGRAVKYILTTLAQLRMLQGYGMGDIEDVDLDLPNKGTSSILTQADVELAVNLAVILETARLYRTYDRDAVEEIDTQFGRGEESGNDGEQEELMSALLDEYAHNGTIDPADIVALYLGIENQELNLEIIIAQGLNAVVDQFVLKYMDYFGLVDIMDAIFKGVQFLENVAKAVEESFCEFLGSLCGESPEERKLRMTQDWVEDTLESKAGLDDTYVLHDISHFVDSITYTITLTKSGTCSHGEPWEVETTYQIETKSQEYIVEFPRQDILRSGMDDKWYDEDSSQDFYEKFHEENTNNVYDTVREKAKEIIVMVVDTILNMAGLDLTQYRSLARPESLNPNDEVSLLEEINSNVDQAIKATKAYFSGSEGRQKIGNIIKN